MSRKPTARTDRPCYLRFMRSALLLVLCVLGVLQPAAGLTELSFTQTFPDTESDGMCRLFRAYGCEVIALVDEKYSSSSSSAYVTKQVAAIFVRGETRTAAEECANKIISTLGDNTACLYPFVGSEPSVAILYRSNPRFMSTVHTMLYPIASSTVKAEQERFTAKFIGWQGKLLVMRFSLANMPEPLYTSTSDTPGSGNKKPRVTLDAALDITTPVLTYAELKVVQNSGGNRELLRDYISSWLFGEAVVPKMVYTYVGGKSRAKKPERKYFNSYEVLVDTTDSSPITFGTLSSTSRMSRDFCLYAKGKLYLAGSKEQVQAASQNKRRKVDSFHFPESEIATSDEPAPADSTATVETPTKTVEPPTETANPTGQQAAPAPVGAPDAPREDSIQSIEFLNTPGAADTTPIITAPATEPSIDPQQALKAYLDYIRSL